MPIPRHHIRAVLAAYLARHPDERPVLVPLQEALSAVADPTMRNTFPGHITCGAVVLDHHGRVLQVRHRALDRYLLPGGHIEQSDTSLVGAALRELHEETHLPVEAVHLLRPCDGVPLDIDAHSIPANAAKGEPDHQHFDFRFTFVASAEHEVRIQTAEATGHRWIAQELISMTRVATKLSALPSPSQSQQ